MQENSRMAKSGATWAHKELEPTPCVGLGSEHGSGEEQVTQPSYQHNPERLPRRQAGPATRRPHLLHSLGFFHRVSARPRSARGDPETARPGSLTGTQSAAQSQATPARRDLRTESPCPQSPGPGLELQACSGGAAELGRRGSATTTSADARLRSNLRPRLRKARWLLSDPGTFRTHAPLLILLVTQGFRSASAVLVRSAGCVTLVSQDFKGKKLATLALKN